MKFKSFIKKNKILSSIIILLVLGSLIFFGTQQTFIGNPATKYTSYAWSNQGKMLIYTNVLNTEQFNMFQTRHAFSSTYAGTPFCDAGGLESGQSGICKNEFNIDLTNWECNVQGNWAYCYENDAGNPSCVEAVPFNIKGFVTYEGTSDGLVCSISTAEKNKMSGEGTEVQSKIGTRRAGSSGWQLAEMNGQVYFYEEKNIAPIPNELPKEASKEVISINPITNVTITTPLNEVPAGNIVISIPSKTTNYVISAMIILIAIMLIIVFILWIKRRKR